MIFSFDSRDEEVSQARHWSDVHVMAGRAFFKENEEPAHLALENVLASDVGSYKCRVDFFKAPTQISEVGLDVIGEIVLISCTDSIAVKIENNVFKMIRVTGCSEVVLSKTNIGECFEESCWRSAALISQ